MTAPLSQCVTHWEKLTHEPHCPWLRTGDTRLIEAEVRESQEDG
jgi:hypothetical protein